MANTEGDLILSCIRYMYDLIDIVQQIKMQWLLRLVHVIRIDKITTALKEFEAVDESESSGKSKRRGKNWFHLMFLIGVPLLNRQLPSKRTT